jgi:hypothetical protein
MSNVVVREAEDLLLRSVVSAQVGLRSMAQRTVRRYAESHPVQFAIILPLAVLAGLALGAFLTVECWRRGYRGFTGEFTRTDGWTSARIRFYCY